MKKYINSLLIPFLMVFAFISCEEEEIATFSGKDVVYFQWALDGVDNYAGAQIDSANVTFAYSLPTQLTDSIIKIPVKVQGFSSNESRTVNVRIMDKSTAEKGIHFEMPDEIEIPANEFIALLPVKINRTADMKLENFSLHIELISNEYFETSLVGENQSDNRVSALKYNQFEVVMNDILSAPIIWSQFLHYYLGDFSAKKLYLFAEVNGYDSVPDFNPPPSVPVLFGQIATFKAYLLEQKAAGTPVLEDDGTEMELGPYA